MVRQKWLRDQKWILKPDRWKKFVRRVSKWQNINEGKIWTRGKIKGEGEINNKSKIRVEDKIRGGCKVKNEGKIKDGGKIKGEHKNKNWD